MTRFATDPSARAALMFALLVSLGGCGWGFNHRWGRLGSGDERTARMTPDSLAGRWEGRWLSAVNGHEGPLWAIVDQVAPERHRFDFLAHWGGVFTFTYGLEMATPAAPAEGIRVVTGEADLGWPYGEYRSRGTLASDGSALEFRYEAASDHGTFMLRRAAP